MPPKAAARDLGDVLELVTRKAQALRAAGVASLTCDGVSIVLVPHEPETTGASAEGASAEPADPFDDPATFGVRGGRVPGYGRPDGYDEE